MSTPQERRPAKPLTSREKEVLEAIVSSYIQTGQPVSSRAISKINSESLSPASLRNIMAELEESGYIVQPHTSAGRVPTDLGYRHYVDGIGSTPSLSPRERAALTEDLYAEGGLDSLIARCCKLLAAASNQVAVGTAPDNSVTAFRHVDFVKLSDQRLLVVFISESGIVHQHVLATRVDETPAELQRCASLLNEELLGRTLPQVRERLAALMKQERAAYDRLARRALNLGAQYFAQDEVCAREVYVDGTEHLIERPDLGDFDRMKHLLQALEDKSRVLRLLDGCLATEGIITAIGSENTEPEMAGLSLVATSYSVDACKLGTLGIIGPTRMEYERAMSLVQHVAQLLSDALANARR